ncbi:hypothetical protein [Thermoflavimicrobium dichotomicum]|uniref:hypothetical protein n=1 Tax=Thermoflavimicrobium dichotomicum TaxID=46223 RepID=UPI003CC6580D
MQTRNFLDRKNKQSANLWTEESLPPDTLLYALLIQRPGKNTDDLSQLLKHLQHDPYIQIGGNETVGQGWMITSIHTRWESI